MDVTGWVVTYGRAWETGDADLVLTLFTEDASYRSLIFDEPHRGHDGIRAYWERVTSQQADVAVRMGRPFVDGERVAVEWWTTMRSDGDELTLPGCLLLTMAADGRCRALREYWHHAPQRRDPPEDWGT